MVFVGHSDPALGSIHVLWPRVLGARRSELGRFNIGDEVHVEFGPGLLQFLSLRLDSGLSLSTGLAPEWTIPIGAGTAAVCAVLELPDFDSINTWTGLGTKIRWYRAGVIGETLDAYARLGKLGRSSATLPYQVYSRERCDLILEGEFIMVSVAGGRPRAFIADPTNVGAIATTSAGMPVAPTPTLTGGPASNSGAPVPHQVDLADAAIPARWTERAPAMTQGPEPRRGQLFSVTLPRIVSRPRSDTPPMKGDIWQWAFSSDLLRLLANPIAGALEPLGRRFHPFGSIFDGMALHAALTMTPDSTLQRAWVRYKKPIHQNVDFEVRSEILDADTEQTETVHQIWQGHIAIGEIEVTVSKMAARTANE
jgi:acyl-CoA thioesterase FadM